MVLRALLEIFDFFNHRKQQKAQVFQIMGLGIILIIIALTSLYAYTSLSTMYNPGIALLMVSLVLGILATVILIIARKINNVSLISNSLKSIKPLSQSLQSENINRLFQSNKQYVPAVLAGVGIFSVYKILFSKKIADLLNKNI
jgi:hypothetical protein